jgi:hypothetical protein
MWHSEGEAIKEEENNKVFHIFDNPECLWLSHSPWRAVINVYQAV